MQLLTATEIVLDFLGSHWDNPVGIPVKFPAGILWDLSEMPGFPVGLPLLSSGEIPVEFPAMTC